MQISLLLGAALLTVSGVFAAKFQPRDRAGRVLCVLLAVMGVAALLFAPGTGILLAVQAISAGVMVASTAAVLALEERSREQERAARRLAAQRAREAGRRSLRDNMQRQRVAALYFHDDCPDRLSA